MDELAALRAENERLRRGDFTPEEFQELCHNRDKNPRCTPAAFFDGCEDYQRKLFGYCEADQMRAERDALRAENAELRAGRAALAATLRGGGCISCVAHAALAQHGGQQ